jgi:hypothetical protein
MPRSFGLRKRKPREDQRGIHLTGTCGKGIVCERVSIISEVLKGVCEKIMGLKI